MYRVNMSRVTMLSVFYFTSIFLLGSVAVTSSHATSPPTHPTPIQAPAPQPSPLVTATDLTGTIGTYSAEQVINFVPLPPFLQPLGTNARTCGTCHIPTQAMTTNVNQTNNRFNNTQGLDPIFLPVDGADSPLDDVSTLAARQAAYSELLAQGVIRIGLTVPEGANFTLTAINDPYGYASAAQLSLFRRPLPAANLRFASTLMWDGRETPVGVSVAEGLLQQAGDAVLTHEQGAFPSQDTLAQIVQYESTFYTAQITDSVAGSLTDLGAQGGPEFLLTQPFFSGINDPFGRNPTGAPFNPNVFTIYNAWSQLPTDGTMQTAQRQSIARGQAIFNTRQFTISGVAGFNDVAGNPNFVGTCSSCHNTPNVGNRSLPDFMHTGIADPPVAGPNLPLYTFQSNATGQMLQTTDPGLALTTGQFADIGKFQVPALRGLSARSAYMHNGVFASLGQVVGFYNKRFNINFTAQEQSDLIAFLQAL